MGKMDGLKQARIKAGMTQAEAAEASKIPLGTIRRWEQGVNEPDIDSIVLLADLYKTSTDAIFGSRFANAVRVHPVDTVPVPIVGRIAAGTPRSAFDQSDEWHETPKTLVDGREGCFWLVVAGNSMNRLFPEGTLVLVDPGQEVRDGDVGAVFVNGYDAALKRVYYEKGAIRLHPESYDPEYRDAVIREDDPEAPEFRAIGRVVSYTAPDGWRA